ncbi:MAG: hypothetical protein WC468_01400 [Candidatus Paceibacterota bacterium]
MTFGEYVIYIFNLGVAMGSVLAFIFIAWSGINILNAGGNPSAVSDAKKRMFNALLGLAVLLVSYVLLTTINPDLVNIKNISLGGVNINVPFLSFGTNQAPKGTLVFEEVPIGTVTESILAGNSSTRNGLECYEYDDETGNPVDKNGDGKITDKDIVLDRDIFYCMKDLDEALRKKTETRLAKLIKELDGLMKSCTCDRVFTNYQPAYDIYNTRGECGCDACTSYCKTCGSPHIGCPGAPGNSQEGEAALEQYSYDPCPNRKQIDCKREEIKQLMGGTNPEQVCYDKGWIDNDAPLPPQLLTFSDGISRISAFRDYFTNQVETLKQLEKNTKSPFGQRLTLSEFYTLQNTYENNIIEKEEFGGYNIYRYCDDYCTKTEIGDDGETKCIEYKLNEDLRACKKSGSIESLMYDGDPATFYFNADYYEQQKESSDATSAKGKEDTCSVYEKDINGVIPIGETVDGTETYGLEVADRIGHLIETIQGVYTTGLAISEIPQSCGSGNCVNAESNCCYSPQCGCDADCCCPTVWGLSTCYKGVPSASKYANFSSYSSGSYLTKPYAGCSGFCGGSDWRTSRQEEDQYFTCSYASFCGLVRKIYQTKEVQSSCYDQTEDQSEKNVRQYNMNIIGYLQKWEERERRLYEITEIKSLKEVDKIDTDTANSVINAVCRSYFINPNEETLECDGSLSIVNKFEKRFYLAEKLNSSRQKMNACITGYSSPYKKNLDQTYVFNCLEGIDHQTVGQLVINPEFPYPSTKASKYQNCYPYNSAGLTQEEKEKCFFNIYRVGDVSDPGCQKFVTEYMDNYYCCK